MMDYFNSNMLPIARQTQSMKNPHVWKMRFLATLFINFVNLFNFSSIRQHVYIGPLLETVIIFKRKLYIYRSSFHQRFLNCSSASFICIVFCCQTYNQFTVYMFGKGPLRILKGTLVFFITNIGSGIFMLVPVEVFLKLSSFAVAAKRLAGLFQRIL